MKKLLIVLLMCSTLVPGFSQNAQIENLENQLDRVESDTQKVMLLEKLAWEWKDQNLGKADAYVDDAISLANSLNFARGKAKSHKTKGVIHWYRGEIGKAVEHLDIALTNFKQVNDVKGESDIYNNLGLAYQMMGDYENSIDYLKKAYTIREEIGDLEGMASSCNNLGVIYQMLGAYDYALNNHLRSLEIHTTLGEDKNSARSLLNIGNVYATLKDYAEAHAHFTQSLEILTEISDIRGMADSHSNLGENNYALNKLEEAEWHYKEALKLREKLEDKTGIRESLTDLGRIASERNEVEAAISYHKQALEVAESIEDQPAILNASLFLGESYLSTGSLEKSKELLVRSLELAKSIDTNPEIAKANRLLSSLTQKSGNAEEALAYQIAYSDAKDAIFDEEKAQALRRMQVVYETDKQKIQIANLEEDYSEAEFQKYSLLVVLVSLILVALSWFLYYKYRSESRTAKMLYSKNKEIEFQNQQLTISNSDLEQFAYVVSHDLKQPLRTIGSFTGLIERRYKEIFDQDGKEYLEFITGGVKHMHQLLIDLLSYSQIGKNIDREAVDLNQVLTDSIQKLRDEIQESQAVIQIDDLPQIMADRSSQVLLFQNLLSNAIKFRGDEIPNIEVRYEDLGEEHLISVHDNGIGIPKEYSSKIFTVFQRLHGPEEYVGTGIGLAACQKVVLQQNGELWVESKPGEGSSFFIRFPKEPITEEDLKILQKEYALPLA